MKHYFLVFSESIPSGAILSLESLRALQRSVSASEFNTLSYVEIDESMLQLVSECIREL